MLDKSAIVLTPEGKHSTYAQILVNVVPLIAFAPQWLVNLAFKNLAFLILLKIRSAKEVTASPVYKDRHMDPNNEFYDFIKISTADMSGSG